MTLKIFENIATSKPYFRQLRFAFERFVVGNKRVVKTFEIAKGIATSKPYFG